MSDKVQAYFKQLTDLVELEYEAEKETYFQRLKKLSPSERRAKGYAWFPLKIESQKYSLGQIPTLKVSRTKAVDLPHQFKGGSQVELYTLQNQNQTAGGKLKGIINWVDRNSMEILFSIDQLPDWVFKNAIGLNSFFDERSYKVMLRALEIIAGAKNCRTADLRDKLLLKSPPMFTQHAKFSFNEHLNDSQNKAIELAVNATDYMVIHGPPGTGKTTTLVNCIKQFPIDELPVLVCAPSNAAVDHLVIKLSEAGLNVLRIGNLSRMKDEVWQQTLAAQIADHPDTASIKKMKKQVSDLRKQAAKFKRNFGFEERQQRRNLRNEAKDLSNQIKIAENYVIHKLVQQADVIATTLVGVQNKYLDKIEFNTLVIDEAAQALEPACWIPLCKAKRVIMAGDPFQLPPTVKSAKAEKQGLGKTLMEKLIDQPNGVKLLNTQYRMNSNIMNITNQYFYKGALLADKTVAYQKLNGKNGALKPVEFIDTAGSGYEEKRNPSSLSYYNPGEYKTIGIHLTKLLQSLENTPTIAIISPYKAQAAYIRAHLQDHFMPNQIAQIQVDTVDAFQGQEKEVIYISMVRSSTKSNIGFLKDYRRMNVAVTRAQKKLVIIGDSATIANDPFYQQLMDYFQESNAYHSVWEFM